MISIQQNIADLETIARLRAMAIENYRYAIGTAAEYVVEIHESITAPHRKYLSDLAAEVREASEDGLVESRATLRGLLRDYRDRRPTIWAASGNS